MCIGRLQSYIVNNQDGCCKEVEWALRLSASSCVLFGGDVGRAQGPVDGLGSLGGMSSRSDSRRSQFNRPVAERWMFSGNTRRDIQTDRPRFVRKGRLCCRDVLVRIGLSVRELECIQPISTCKTVNARAIFSGGPQAPPCLAQLADHFSDIAGQVHFMKLIHTYLYITGYPWLLDSRGVHHFEFRGRVE